MQFLQKFIECDINYFDAVELGFGDIMAIRADRYDVPGGLPLITHFDTEHTENSSLLDRVSPDRGLQTAIIDDRIIKRSQRYFKSSLRS